MQQRLFQITYYLIAHGHTTAGQLAERFEVSTRTILRDIDTLSAAGIPVYTTRGKDGGIHILPDYVVDRSLLTSSEQIELLSQLQSLSAIGVPSSAALLEKLSSLFSNQQHSWLEVNFSPWGGGAETNQLFELLRTSIIQQRKVSFSYFSSLGQSSERLVEPYKVIFRGQGWYLYAYCLSKNEPRFFKLTRMKNTEKSSFFTPREVSYPVESSSDVIASPSVVLDLRFPFSASYRVYDEFPPSSVQKKGAYLFVSLSLPAGNWLIGYLLSFGTDIEVLSPASIRKQLQESALAIAANNRSF